MGRRKTQDHSLDSGAANTSSLGDGSTLEVVLEVASGSKVVYTAKSDHDFKVEVLHHENTDGSGVTIAQDASGGTVTGGQVDGREIACSGLAATVRLTDESGDGQIATAKVQAKAVGP